MLVCSSSQVLYLSLFPVFFFVPFLLSAGDGRGSNDICLLCSPYDCTMTAGFNSTLREGNVTHHEYIQVGKGRDVGLNQISQFEAKIANGNGEQTLSRDIYRLGHRFDFFRMLSCYFTTVGSYFSTLVCCY